MSRMCFANEGNKCKALKVEICQGKECPFRKTKRKLKDDKRKVYNRIASLDNSKQNHIANKYYFGNYPWRKAKTDESGKSETINDNL